MNSVDKFVFQSMVRYPSIFPTREAVLNHALFVIGNAIPWHDGELVSDRSDITVKAGLAKIDNTSKEERDHIDEMVVAMDMEDCERTRDMVATMHAREEARLDDYREVVRNAEQLAVIKCPVGATNIGYYACEFCTYSNIYNIPDDVTPEWLEACYEIAEWSKAENPHYDEIIARLDTVKNMSANRPTSITTEDK
jgi:hypothetical protein